jgi:hypothetical protein
MHTCMYVLVCVQSVPFRCYVMECYVIEWSIISLVITMKFYESNKDTNPDEDDSMPSSRQLIN